MTWHPIGTRLDERRWVWATLAVWICIIRGPAFIRQFEAPREIVPDFFQEYGSARNYFEGLPIYSSHLTTIERYLGRRTDERRPLVVVNAHPPTSVLLALPFAGLDFDRAFLLWNLASLGLMAASLWLVKRGLQIPFSAWSLLPTSVMILLCSPLWEQIRMGQLNLALLLLLTGAWASERSNRPRLAGTLLGAAAAVKLFPGFLLLYFALRRRWAVVTAGVLALTVLTMLTAAVLGPETYRAYIQDVLPETQWFRVGWNNASLSGFWSRLFDPAPERSRSVSRTEPLWYDPVLADICTWASSAAVVALLAWNVRRVGSCTERDLAFGLATTAMILVSPIAWDHYLLLLLVPLAVHWARPRRSILETFAFALVVMMFLVSPPFVWSTFRLGGRVARPVHSLTVLPYQTYALLSLFALGIAELRRERDRAPGRI